MLRGVRQVARNSLNGCLWVWTTARAHAELTRCCDQWFGRTQMRRQYLRLFAYSCDKCRGTVVSGSIAARKNAETRQTHIREVGAMRLSCGQRQNKRND